MHCKIGNSRKTKVRVTTSNPQHPSLARLRLRVRSGVSRWRAESLIIYETTQRSVARYNGRRDRSSGSRPSAVWRALVSRVRRRDLTRRTLVGACRELHARSRKTHERLDVARRPECDLLVRLGALYSVDRLAVAAFPIRAAGARARRPRARAIGRGLRVRPYCRDGGRAVVAGVNARAAVVDRGQAVRAHEFRLGDDDVLGDC